MPEKTTKLADPVVHHAFGALVGGLYGGLISKAPLSTRGAGTLYGGGSVVAGGRRSASHGVYRPGARRTEPLVDEPVFPGNAS